MAGIWCLCQKYCHSHGKYSQPSRLEGFGKNNLWFSHSWMYQIPLAAGRIRQWKGWSRKELAEGTWLRWLQPWQQEPEVSGWEQGWGTGWGGVGEEEGKCCFLGRGIQNTTTILGVSVNSLGTIICNSVAFLEPVHLENLFLGLCLDLKKVLLVLGSSDCAGVRTPPDPVPFSSDCLVLVLNTQVVWS